MIRKVALVYMIVHLRRKGKTPAEIISEIVLMPDKVYACDCSGDKIEFIESGSTTVRDEMLTRLEHMLKDYKDCKEIITSAVTMSDKDFLEFYDATLVKHILN